MVSYHFVYQLVLFALIWFFVNRYEFGLTL
jgi:hypothetical protein